MLGEFLCPWWSGAELRDYWAQERAKMNDAYPLFRLIDRWPRPFLDADEAARCGELVRTWCGVICPFPLDVDDEELLNIIADLRTGNGDLIVTNGGGLRHSRHCGRTDHQVPAEAIPQRVLNDSYEIEIAYAQPPARPIVRGVRPRITTREYPDMPHPTAPLKALCVAHPPVDRWNWRVDGAVLYADWTAFYLAKHTLWLESRERLGAGKGLWPGDSAGHQLEELVTAPRNAPCSCGTELTYKRCHLEFDLQNVERKRQGLQPLPRPMWVKLQP